jgi:hypothetical protein
LGLRYVMLGLRGLCVGGLWFSSCRVLASHDKVLASPGELKSYTPEAKRRLDRMARAVRRWLRATFAVAVLTVWAFVLWYIQDTWPDVVWVWLQPWL